MANTSVEIPTLNPFTAFPFEVDPIDQDWLRQWCQFEPIPATPDSRIAPDANHYED